MRWAPDPDRPAAEGGGHLRDAGFTLVELMVALSVTALVGTFALSAQLANSRATRTEANRQVAAQVLARELDKARGLGGTVAATDLAGTDTQQVNALELQVTRTVDTCFQIVGAGGTTSCTTAAAQPAGSAEMEHVTITVAWQEGAQTFSQSGDILINADPVFPS
ncbi:PilW family protein [Actinoplanes sp. CA-030573]|uniref:PilW family protein n=1 Tax=Actinoplanes sp. CA-030573 TaxID=3239898 RepID=UPI003D8FE3EA